MNAHHVINTIAQVLASVKAIPLAATQSRGVAVWPFVQDVAGFSQPATNAPAVRAVGVPELPFHFFFLERDEPVVQNAELRRRCDEEGERADIDGKPEERDDHADIHGISGDAKRAACHQYAIGG